MYVFLLLLVVGKVYHICVYQDEDNKLKPSVTAETTNYYIMLNNCTSTVSIPCASVMFESVLVSLQVSKLVDHVNLSHKMLLNNFSWDCCLFVTGRDLIAYCIAVNTNYKFILSNICIELNNGTNAFGGSTTSTGYSGAGVNNYVFSDNCVKNLY